MMRNIAVFDFDGTIIAGDSVVALLRYAQKQGVICLPRVLYAGLMGVLYHLNLVSAQHSKRVAHAFLTRLSPEKREALLRAFAQTLVDRAYPQALAQLQQHRQNGDLILLCSASCACYMRYVAALLPVDALLCTPSAENGAMLGPNCKGEEKVRRVSDYLRSQGLDMQHLLYGYGDSGTDAPILRQCKKPVLVNPKQALKKLLPTAQVVFWHE